MNSRLRAATLLLCLSASICCATGPSPSSRSVSASVVVAAAQPGAPPQAQVPLPNKPDTLKFAVIGDNGNGERGEYDIGQQLAAWHARFAFPIVVMMGDNIYGSDRPQDFVRKFEAPYKALLDAGVKFYATLGNHDSREQRFYKYFNMDGKLYYTFKAPKGDVRFFALESTYMDPDQVKWIGDELEKSGEDWKIVFFHHPLYSSAKTHGSQVKLREVLEPLFVRYKVSLVLSGHDHTYERITPQNGIQYFVEGSSGQLREGDLRQGSPLTAFGNDRDQTFMLMEVDGDQLTFNAITRVGAVIDSGVIQRRK
jgi:predicted MPP superfamily phosphohydrolase